MLTQKQSDMLIQLAHLFQVSLILNNALSHIKLEPDNQNTCIAAEILTQMIVSKPVSVK